MGKGIMMMKLVNAAAMPQATDVNFNDLAQAGSYARDAIEIAAQAGIIQGYPDGSFHPKGQTTRAETTKMLINLLLLDLEVRDVLK